MSTLDWTGLWSGLWTVSKLSRQPLQYCCSQQLTISQSAHQEQDSYSLEAAILRAHMELDMSI